MRLRKKLKKMSCLLMTLILSSGVSLTNAGSKPVLAASTGDNAYVGQIALFPYNFVPTGWLECNGQTLNVNQYVQLFTLIGIKFGGDGRTTFKLPDLTKANPISGVKYYIAVEGNQPVQDDPSGIGNGHAGEICLFPYSFAPAGWLPCDGKALSSTQYSALYKAIGTKFGGNTTNFKTPNLTYFAPIDNLKYYICIDEQPGYDFLGSIDLFASNNIPSGYSKCDGQVLQTRLYTQLSALLGSRFGGDGKTTFAIPNLTQKSPSSKLSYYMSTIGVYPPRQ